MKQLLRLIGILTALVMAVVTSSQAAVAQATDPPVNGFIVGVQAEPDGSLARFAVSDSGGTVHEYTVSDSTQFGLENLAGDRWISTFAESPVEAVTRLRDHQQRLATVTVTSSNGTAGSVVEREGGRLDANLGYLFAVFAVTWAGFFAYMFWVSRKQHELQRQIARLSVTVEQASGVTK